MMPKKASKKPGNLIILSGPSGVGKTTLRRRLQRKMPEIRFSVSWTTRPRRAGEVDGRDYRFVPRRRFEKAVAEQGFLEWAQVHEAYYGTPEGPVRRWLKEGRDVLLDIDVQGARQVKRRMPEAVSVFILPPSRKELWERLKKRRTESRAAMRLRLENARKELEGAKDFDYLVVNREIPAAVEALRHIVLAARYRNIQ